jgi:KDO2-lipid IV(A) lauroyltransferase
MWFGSGAMRQRLARTVAFAAYRLSITKRRSSERNVSQAFEGTLRRDRVRAITRYSFYHFWSEAFSMPCPNPLRTHRLRIDIRGLENLQRARDIGRGAILWESSAFGLNFLAKQVLYQRGFAVHQIYAENHSGGFSSPCPASWMRQRVITRFFDECEKQYVVEILNLPLWDPLPVMRVLFERLRRNAILCVDGNGTLGWRGVRRNFFGVPRVFFTGTVSLSRLAGAPILPLFCVRESDRSVALIIEPPIAGSPSDARGRAPEACIERYIALLESYVRRHPEQFWSWHSLGTPNITLPEEGESRVA